MKYLGKREKSPEGMNSTFMLASRKNGGIGSAYAEQLRAFYEQQPDTCDMSVINIYTGQSLTTMLPRYYRMKFMPSTSMCYDPNFIKYFKDTIRWFEIARYLHKQYRLPFKFTYPEEYLRLVRMTGKTPYYNPYKTVVNDTFIKYYLPQFCSQTVYEDLYYKAFSYALDCLSTALVFFDSSQVLKHEKSLHMNVLQQSAINARMAMREELNLKKASYDVREKMNRHYRKEKI
jgi:hypothetical protein